MSDSGDGWNREGETKVVDSTTRESLGPPTPGHFVVGPVSNGRGPVARSGASSARGRGARRHGAARGGR